MKHSSLAQFGAAAATLLLFTACGGDRHGSATVPRQASFVGLWMSDAAHRDISQNIGNLDRFCAVASENPSRHGLNKIREGYPSVPILEIVPGGTIYRWYPTLQSARAEVVDKYTMGRLDSAGVAAMQGYQGNKLGVFRFVDFDHLSQIDGTDPFPAGTMATGLAASYSRNPEFNAYATEKRGFTRIDRGFAELYVSQLCQCDPANFGLCAPSSRRPGRPDPASPTAREPISSREPIETPAPSSRPSGNRPVQTPSWKRDPVAPPATPRAAPAAPNRGHEQGEVKDGAGYMKDEPAD